MLLLFISASNLTYIELLKIYIIMEQFGIDIHMYIFKSIVWRRTVRQCHSLGLPGHLMCLFKTTNDKCVKWYDIDVIVHAPIISTCYYYLPIKILSYLQSSSLHTWKYLHCHLFISIVELFLNADDPYIKFMNYFLTNCSLFFYADYLLL